MSTMIRSTSFLAVRGARTTVTRRWTRFRWSTWKAGTVQSSISAVVTVLPTPQKSDPWLLIHLHYLSFPHHRNDILITSTLTLSVLPTPQKSCLWSCRHLHCLMYTLTLSVLPTPQKWRFDHVYTYTICPSHTTEMMFWSLIHTICPSHTAEMTFWSLIHLHYLSFPHYRNHVFDHLYTYTIRLSHTMEITSLVTLNTMFFPHHINYIFSHFIHYLSFPHHGNQVLIILYTGLDHFIHYLFFPHHINHILDLHTLSVLPTPWKSHPWWLDTLSVLPTPWKPLSAIFPSHATEIMSFFDLV